MGDLQEPPLLKEAARLDISRRRLEMRTPTIIRRTVEAFAVFGAAFRAAGAAEAHRKPAERDLERLRIRPGAFDDIWL
jgi:hypothetical protein